MRARGGTGMVAVITILIGCVSMNPSVVHPESYLGSLANAPQVIERFLTQPTSPATQFEPEWSSTTSPQRSEAWFVTNPTGPIWPKTM